MAPHKCSLTLMKRKWGKVSGRAALMNKKDAPGTIIIKDAMHQGSEPIYLKRLDVKESDRQLGVIIPIDLFSSGI